MKNQPPRSTTKLLTATVTLSVITAITLAACTRKSTTPGRRSNQVEFQAPKPTLSPPVSTVVSTDVPLISRETFFSYPKKMRLRISLDGERLAYLAPIESGENKGKIGLYVTDGIDKDKIDEARLVYVDPKGRPVDYHWTAYPDTLVFLQDLTGAENQQLFILNVKTGGLQNITNDPKVKTALLGQKIDHPNLYLYSKNDRDKRYFDTYVLNLEDGTSRLLYKNEENFLNVSMDDDLQPRIATKYGDEGNMLYYYREAEANAPWTILFDIPFENVSGFGIGSIDYKNSTMYLLDGRTTPTRVLKKYNLKTKAEEILGVVENADITGLLTEVRSHKPLLAQAEFTRTVDIPLTPEFKTELEAIHNINPGFDFQILSQTLDDKKWLLAFSSDTKLFRYYLWDRTQQNATLLLVMQPELDALPLSKMNPVVIPSRDNLKLVSYLTLPAGVTYDPETLKPNKPVPMVLYVHGGPWTRDSWGYDPIHQWLSNRGYAVLSVNYRGSSGFGKAFTAASFGEWGRRMHDDLIDATNWAIKNGIAMKDRVAIMGASYGGYATLAGLTFTPNVFAAGVDTVGVANLVTFAKSIPDYWKPFKTNNIRRMGGDETTEEGRRFLESRSPVFKANQIKRPLLIGHGDNDQRVKLAEATQITNAMKKANRPVTLVRFSDEGHGFVRRQNTQSYYGVVEVFLKRYLGGRAEPIALIPGTTLNVTEGANLIEGLPKALADLRKAESSTKKP